MPGEIHHVGTVIVQAVDQVDAGSGSQVLNRHEVAVLRRTQHLLALSHLPVHAQPNAVRLRAAIRMKCGRLRGVRVGGQVEQPEGSGSGGCTFA